MSRHPAGPAAAIPALLLGLALGLAACTVGAGPRSSADATSVPSGAPGGNAATPPSGPGTFETTWGMAWDELPPGFPLPPDAQPADPGDPVEGPVSAAFVVDLSPADAAAAEQAGLARAGYSTEALSGPSEDGSLVIDSTGRDPACRVQTTLRPLGGTTMVTILYGAGCPWG